jgi:leader peptidase (prepilin peptidase)/N-methyltransferase
MRLLLVVGLGVVGALLGVAAARASRVLHERYPTAAELLNTGHDREREERLRLTGCVVATAALFALAGLRWGATARLVPNLWLFVVLVAMSAVDLERSLIPNRLVFPSLAVAIAAVAVASAVDGTLSTLRFALVGAVTFFVGLLLAHLLNPAGMGLGDVKLALLLGWFVGWAAHGFGNAMFLVLIALLVASLTGSVVGVVLLARRGRGARYPFGPWLALGTVVVLLLTPVAAT